MIVNCPHCRAEITIRHGELDPIVICGCGRRLAINFHGRRLPEADRVSAELPTLADAPPEVPARGDSLLPTVAGGRGGIVA